MDAFLLAYADCGIIRLASKQAGIPRQTVYAWKDADVDGFAERFRMADRDVDDMIEGEMFRRGYRGVEEPVYQGGKRVGTVRKYSDRLLEMLAKARMPHRFRERHEVSGVDGGPLEFTIRMETHGDGDA